MICMGGSTRIGLQLTLITVLNSTYFDAYDKSKHMITLTEGGFRQLNLRTVYVQ